MKQPWIYSASLDIVFILAPALTISALLLWFHDSAANAPIQPWMWGVLIVGVDVSHVYSTLFRTYTDSDELRARRTLYTLAPLLGWIVGTLLYSINSLYFWRAITYLAVFHFVRQQYGFMMIYARKEHAPYRVIDKAAIYMATLYPLIYWHTHMPRQFEWFIEGDFFSLPSSGFSKIGFMLYVLIMVGYFIKEVWLSFKLYRVNLPKNLLVCGTAVSWWVGIISFNNDLAFTAANVLSHGIPYMALIWVYGRNQAVIEPQKSIFGLLTLKQFFSVTALPLFIGILVLFSYLEEGIWDGFIWSEHKHLFAPFHFLPAIEDKATLAWLVPLLALPQITHYVLDAFIWRMKTQGAPWSNILFYRAEYTS